MNCCFACSHHESHFTAIRRQSTSVHSFMESSLNAKANSRQRRELFLIHADLLNSPREKSLRETQLSSIKTILLLQSECLSFENMWSKSEL